MQRIIPAGLFPKGTRHFFVFSTLLLSVTLVGCGEGAGSGVLTAPSDTGLPADTSPENTSNNGSSESGRSDSRPVDGEDDDADDQRGSRPLSREAAAQASRFLAQATFGPRRDEIDALVRGGNDFAAWIDDQMQKTPTLHRPLAQTLGGNKRMNAWWSAVVDHDDQLRQRMAWALSQILVISDFPTILRNHQDAVLDYYDLLARQAFGSYRDLLEDVTLSLPMGIYLSMKDSRKYDPATGAHPDENYAREVMQLFTIGLWQLDESGRRILKNGQPIPTYGQQDVEALARIFSGWSSADSWSYGNDFSRPMKAYPQYHDDGEKIFLGERFPAGQTPEEDLRQALDILFNHPNTGPFISRQLIQRFVTSNPSPDYVRRVAAVFADNGRGERGDLGAVVRAILLDDEARHLHRPDEAFGKLREPLLRVTHLWRNHHGKVKAGSFWKPEKDFLQAPLRSPTVFNFYPPDFSPVGELRDRNLVAPEFAITTTTSITTTTNKLYSMIYERWDAESSLDLGELETIATDADALIDWLDLVYCAGGMSDALRETIASALSDNAGTPRQRARDALYLVIGSAEYAVAR